MNTFVGWMKEEILNESNTRYSVEVNYRSQLNEVLDQYAKICLGYTSAALKNANFHVKQVFEQDPIRIMVSARNWDDGEWVVLVSWNKKNKHFTISKGFYNKDRQTVSVQDSKETKAENAAELFKEINNLMHHLKGVKDRHIEKLKKVPMKKGPK